MAYITTVRLPDELAEQVKVYCARTGASVNGALVVAVERLVAAPARGMYETDDPAFPRVRSLEDGLAGREPTAGAAGSSPSGRGARLEPVSRPANSSEAPVEPRPGTAEGAVAGVASGETENASPAVARKVGGASQQVTPDPRKKP